MKKAKRLKLTKEEKKKQSQIDHVLRLATAIQFGGSHPIFKTHWCNEHKKYEY